MHDNQIPNPYLNYATRRIILDSSGRSKVLDFDVDSGETWQAWIFSNQSTNKSTLIEFVLRGSFGTTGTIPITIGGGDSGQLITGTGSCEVFATGTIGNDISVWFTPEQTTRSLPSISQLLTINSSPAYTTIGYPPFGRNFCNIQTNANYTVRLLDDNGIAIRNGVLAPPTLNNTGQGLYHPSNTVLEILNSVPNQNFVVSHYQ